MAAADENSILRAALQWQVEAGADEAFADEPVDATRRPERAETPDLTQAPIAAATTHRTAPTSAVAVSQPADGSETLRGSTEIRQEAVRLAAAADTLEALRAAIAAFDGLAIKKTATNLVFSDGNANAPVMLISEAPGADEDRQGKPFAGAGGQMLDRILACIGLSRDAEDPDNAVYISNILNWRPPGNRSPNAAEIDTSLPFIERHIALVRPRILILCGGVAAQSLLGRTDGISKMRGTVHAYTSRTPGITKDADTPDPIPAITTYHPAHLLRTPSQKRAVWQDMLTLQEKLRESAS